MTRHKANYPSFKGELLAVILGLRKFEHILSAKRFLIRTDSSAITFLTSMCESFDFDIKHISGKTNTAADALSRAVFPSQPRDPDEPDSFLVYPDIEDVYSIENNKIEWTLEYKKDLPLSQVMEFVKIGITPSNLQRQGLPERTNQMLRWFKYLYIEDGLLYIHKPSSNGGSESRVVVPMGLQSKLIHEAHKGHTGINETLNKLRLWGYFPGMSDQVTLVVSNCIQCLQKSNQVPRHKGKSTHRELLSYPMQRIYIDTVGPLTPSRINGKIMKHIFTILDGFTRYLIAIPIPDLESSTLLNSS